MKKIKYLKNPGFSLIWILFIWIVLFEFILPSNNFLPKPSIVLLSLSALEGVYHLWVNLSISISELYVSLIISYLITKILCENFSGFHFVFNIAGSIHKLFNYLPVIIFGILLVLWFPNSNYTGFVFIFLISLTAMMVKTNVASLKINKEYFEASISLGAGQKMISKNVIWKFVQPILLDFMSEIHIYLWISLLMFEFINGSFGLGAIFKTALQFKDLSALFSISIITGLLIFIGFKIIKYIRNKFIHWSNI